MTAKHVETRDPFLLAASLADLSPAAMAALSADEAEAVVIACERVMAAVQARQSLAVDTLASRVEEDLAREEQSRPSPRGFSGPDVHGLVASMLAPALHCSTRTVQRRLLSDRWLVRTLDSTLAAHWDGDFERHRAEILVEAAHNVDPDLVQQFEAQVLESSLDPVTGELVAVSERVRRMSRAQLSRRAGKIARELDPGSHAEAVRRAREERAVIVQPDRHRPGMARWLAFLPSDVSQRVFAAVDGLASQYARANAGTPIDAHRADALADLVLGSAEVKTVIELVVPVLPGRPTSTTSAFGELNPVTAAIVAPLTPAAPIDTSAPGRVIGYANGSHRPA